MLAKERHSRLLAASEGIASDVQIPERAFERRAQRRLRQLLSVPDSVSVPDSWDECQKEVHLLS